MYQEFNSIERSPHDESNPYAQILHKLIKDDEISPNCRLVLISLLSNRDGWVININQLKKEYKNWFGKDKLYEIIDEALEAGYLMREIYTVNNLKRYKYYLSEKKRFKKCFRYPDSQDTEFQDPENPDSKQEYSLTKNISNKCTVCVKPPVVNQAVVPETPIEAKLSVCVNSSPEAPHHEVKILTIAHADKSKPPHKISKQDLFQLSVQLRKDWTPQEIEEAWIILEKYSEPVRNLSRFIEVTIENKRKINKIKALKENTECHLSPQNFLKKKKQKPLIKEQENIEQKYSAEDMMKPIFPVWLGIPKCKNLS